MNPGRSRLAQQLLLRTALSLAARGWHVFPCAPGRKFPALKDNWKLLATTDPARIRRWWAVRQYNIAIACGPSGLVVVDLDMPGHTKYSGDSRDIPKTGADEFARLCRDNGEPLPVLTFRVTTPSGGEHLYFSAQDPRIRNSAGQLGPLIDVRADRGYVVAPGSRTERGGYDIIDQRLPTPLPPWLAERLTAPPVQPPPPDPGLPIPHAGMNDAKARAALRYESERVAEAPEGTRHSTLNRAAFKLGQLVPRHLTARDVEAALTDAAARAGLPDGEVRRTIASGMSAGQKHPRSGDSGGSSPA